MISKQIYKEKEWQAIEQEVQSLLKFYNIIYEAIFDDWEHIFQSGDTTLSLKEE